MLLKLQRIFLGLLLVSAMHLHSSYGYDFYANCTKSYEFSDSPIDPIILSPLNRVCQSRCDGECSAFSRRALLSPLTAHENDKIYGPELNEDVIQSCMEACQAGSSFSSFYKEADPSDAGKNIVRGPVSIAANCNMTSEEKKKNAIRTSFTIKHGDKIKISLAGQGGNSKIYMCGKKTVLLQPIFPNIKKSGLVDQDVWNNSTTQTEWTSAAEHICFDKIANIQSIPNRNIWSGKLSSDICSWHARNPNYVNTGIYAADGDELLISWIGNYAYTTIILGGTPKPADRSILVKRMTITDDSVTSAEKDHAKDLFSESSNIMMRLPGGTSGIVLYGEAARVGLIGVGNVDLDASSITPYKVIGLTGKVIDHGLVTEFDSAKCNGKNDYKKRECMKVTAYKGSDYSISGILEGFSNTKSELAFKHFDPSQLNPLSYGNHYGGYEVLVQFGGCPFSRGEQIQYAIVLGSDANENNKATSMYSEIPDIPEADWRDVSQDILDGNEDLEIIMQNPDTGGRRKDKLFLRIKPLEVPIGATPEIKKLYEDPEHRYGKYYIFAQQVSQSKGLSLVKNGLITEIIVMVRDVLFGSNRVLGQVSNDGVVPKIYKAITSEQNFIDLIRVMIIMYIVFQAIGFIIGVVKIGQEQFIKELIKLSFVIVAISPTSWEFFSIFLVSLLVDGTTEIISLIVQTSAYLDGSGLSPEDLKRDPYKFFEIFDIPLNIMIGTPTWKKICAILFHDFFGIIIILIMAIIIFMYLVIIAKTTVLYLISLVGMSFCIVMAPIMIPLILFKLTKTIFDNWIRQLLSLFLQPVMVFTSVAMFNIVIVMVFKMLLGFTVCPDCFIYVDLGPIYRACWLSVWSPVIKSHMPSDVILTGSFTNKMALCLTLLILIDANNKLITFLPSLASLITVGNFLRNESIGGATAQATSMVKGSSQVIGKFAYSSIKSSSPPKEPPKR